MAGFDDVALQKYHWLEKINHVHTGGNSSGIVDGAALVLVGREKAGKRPGPDPAGAHRGHRHQRRGADDHADRPDARHPQGAGPGRADGRRHRPVRAERGVRVRGAEVPEGPEHPRREAQRQRRRHRDGPPAGRHRRHDRRTPWSTSSSAAAPAARWSPCASAAAWASPPSSSESEETTWQRTPFSGIRMPTASSP